MCVVHRVTQLLTLSIAVRHDEECYFTTDLGSEHTDLAEKSDR